MHQRLYDNGITVVSRTPAPNPNGMLVVTFDQMHANNPERPGFGEVVLTAGGFDVVAVQKRRENWYQDLSAEDLRGVCRSFVADADSVWTYGSSMGAYAAVYFADALDALALSLSPRHPEYYSRVGMNDYAKQFSLNHEHLATRKPASVAHVVMWDPTNKIDDDYTREQVEVAFPKATLAAMPFVGHPTTQLLADTEALRPLALSLFSGRAPELRSARRAVRGSPRYQTAMRDALRFRAERRAG